MGGWDIEKGSGSIRIRTHPQLPFPELRSLKVIFLCFLCI